MATALVTKLSLVCQTSVLIRIALVAARLVWAASKVARTAVALVARALAAVSRLAGKTRAVANRLAGKTRAEESRLPGAVLELAGMRDRGELVAGAQVRAAPVAAEHQAWAIRTLVA
jgi:hypothetical protein